MTREEELEAALNLALRYLDEGHWFPSDEYVSMAMVACNITTQEALDTIKKATDKWDADPPKPVQHITVEFFRE